MCIARTSLTGTLDTLSLVIYSWELVRITPSSNTISAFLSSAFENIFKNIFFVLFYNFLKTEKERRSRKSYGIL